MDIINYISITAVPFVIFFIISYALLEKVKVFDSFLSGCTEGIETVIKIFPTLIGLFLAISALRSSGILDLLTSILSPLLNLINFPTEVLPLALIRPISGSASTAVALDIMQTYGVDTIIGSIASTIMGSTETTLYTIAIYTSAVKIKNIRFVLVAAIIADIVRNAYICRFLSLFVMKFFLTFVSIWSIINIVSNFITLQIFNIY